jgi:hypothetical protein
MAHSPLELYEEAYRLQYHDKKIHEAVKVYEAVIREFPDSNECAYSVIQLQKVKAGDIYESVEKNAFGRVFALFIHYAYVKFLRAPGGARRCAAPFPRDEN